MTHQMKAAVYTRYGPPEVLQIQSIPRPDIKPDQVLIRVHASAVTTGDARLRAWDIPSLVFSIPARLMIGLFKPLKEVLGTSVAGVIEEIGSDVSGLSIGDRVIGSTEMNFGGHAEYASVRGEGYTRRLPDSVSFEEGAAIGFGGATGLYFLRDLGNLSADQRVLIIGASGSLGASGIQLAKQIGAHVTAMCSGKNHELVRSLGADEVIDYTKEDFTERVLDEDQRFDAIYDTAGKSSFTKTKHLLASDGVYLPAVMTFRELVQVVINKRVKSGVAMMTPEKLETLMTMAGSGELKAVIDQVFPFTDIREAHRRVESGQKRGEVVVRIAES